MSKLIRNLGLFLVGLALAFLAARYGLIRELATYLQPSKLTSEAAEKGTASGSPDISENSSAEMELKRAPVVSANPLEELTPSERLPKLLDAVDLGTLESLHLLRPKYIESLPDYETDLLPALKQRLLEKLLNLFGQADWENWQRSSYIQGGKPSTARVFVDDVSIVNVELGRYLETAAQLFHELFVSTSEGNTFNLERGLDNIVINAEEILAYRKKTAVPARSMFIEEIDHDPTFRSVFEATRGDLVLKHMREYPEEYAINLSLVLALEPRLVKGDVLKEISRLLLHISLSSNGELRRNILNDPDKLETLEKFASANPSIRKSLAEFFVVVAVDTLEHGDRQEAGRLLRRSIALMPELKSQKLLASHLYRSSPSAKVDSERTQTHRAMSEAAEVEDSELNLATKRPDTSGGFSWGTLLVGLLLVGGGVIVAVYRAHTRGEGSDSPSFDFGDEEATDFASDQPKFSLEDLNLDEFTSEFPLEDEGQQKKAAN